MELDIINAEPKKVFLKYLIPSMLSMLAVSAYSFVDTVVVGQAMGAQAVAAMGLGTPIVSMLYALGFLCGSGGAVRYSVAMGLNEKEKAQSIFSTSFYIAILLGILICIFGNLFVSPLADFLGATNGNKGLTTEYLRWILTLAGFFIMDLVFNNFMRNEGYPNVSMLATLTGTVLNIILDILFVMVLKWGMGGAASATCLASIVSVGINLSYALVKKTNLQMKLRKFKVKELLEIVKIGSASFVLEGAVAVITVVFLKAVGKYYGESGVSSLSIIFTLNLVCYSLFNGVAQAVQPLISINYGAGKIERINQFVKYGLIISVSLGVAFFGIGELFTSDLCNMFVEDSAEVLQLASYGLRFHSVTFIFMAVSILYGIYFQSVTKPIQALAILLGRSAILPIVIMYAITLIVGGIGVWIAIPIGEFIAMIIAIILRRKDYS